MDTMAVITILGDVPANNIVLSGSVSSCIMLARRYENWIGRERIRIVDGLTGILIPF